MAMQKKRGAPADVQWRSQQASTMPSLQQPQQPIHQQPPPNAAANHSFWYTSPTHYATQQPDLTRRDQGIDYRYGPPQGAPQQQQQHPQHSQHPQHHAASAVQQPPMAHAPQAQAPQPQQQTPAPAPPSAPRSRKRPAPGAPSHAQHAAPHTVQHAPQHPQQHAQQHHAQQQHVQQQHVQQQHVQQQHVQQQHPQQHAQQQHPQQQHVQHQPPHATQHPHAPPPPPAPQQQQQKQQAPQVAQPAPIAQQQAPQPSVQQPTPQATAPAPASAQPTAPAPAPAEDAPAALPPPAKKSRTNTPWTPAEEHRLKAMRDAGNTWAEIAKTFPTRTEGSVKKHWYKDMHYAEFAEDESQALLSAIKEYENNKWKVIGQKVGKPAKACEQYAKEHFPDLFPQTKGR